VQIVAGQYLDRRRGDANRVGTPGRCRDVHVQQLLNRQLLPLALNDWGGLLRDSGDRMQQEADEDNGDATQPTHCTGEATPPISRHKDGRNTPRA
jgi:hypothetical protein